MNRRCHTFCFRTHQACGLQCAFLCPGLGVFCMHLCLVCVYVCVCVCYVCIHVYVHLYFVFTCGFMCICICVRVFSVCVCTGMLTCIYLLSMILHKCLLIHGISHLLQEESVSLPYLFLQDSSHCQDYLSLCLFT